MDMSPDPTGEAAPHRLTLSSKRRPQYTVLCKDCGAAFTYSQAYAERMQVLGQSPPERCEKHRKVNSEEIRRLGLSHHRLRPRVPGQPVVVRSAGLGSLTHPPRVRLQSFIDADPSGMDVGITDEDVGDFFRAMARPEVQVAIVEGETGSGKSTVLPYLLLDPPEGYAHDQFTKFGQIVVTEPTLQATQRTPDTIAKKLYGGSLGAGQEIGFRHGKLEAVDRRNLLVFVTDGTLINWIGEGRLSQIGTVMIDEAHERSLNIELCLGLLRRELPKYPHLKLIIASATIDAGRFEAAFSDVTSVRHFGFRGSKKFGYELHFAAEDVDLDSRTAAQEAVLQRVVAIVTDTRYAHGDILAFLPTTNAVDSAVRDCRERIDRSRLSSHVVLPLHSKLVPDEQRRALAPAADGQRKIIFSTTMAETSLSVPGIVHVVDSGLVMHPVWDPVSETTEYRPRPHSKAGCRQRWGRAGRMEPGHAHCVYSEAQFESFTDYSTAEIERAQIDELVLTAKASGVGSLHDFPWLTAPRDEELDRAERVLREAGALDGDGDLTQHGADLKSFPMPPTFVSLLLNADELACAIEMSTVIASLLSFETDDSHIMRVERNWDAATHAAAAKAREVLRAGCTDDVDLFFKVFTGWSQAGDHEDWCQRYFVRLEVMRNIEKRRLRLLKALSEHKKDPTIRDLDYRLGDKVRMILASAMRGRLYAADPGENDGRLYRRHAAATDEQGAMTSPDDPDDRAKRDGPLRIDYRSCCSGPLPAERDALVALPVAHTPPKHAAHNATYLAAVPQAWAAFTGGDLCDLGVAANGILKQANGDWISEDRRHRVQLSLNYGIGDSVELGTEPQDPNSVEVTRRLGQQPVWAITTVDGERQKPFVPPEQMGDELTVLPPEVEVEPVEDEEDKDALSTMLDEVDDVRGQADERDDARLPAVSPLEPGAGRSPRGRLTQATQEDPIPRVAMVSGYDFGCPETPLLLSPLMQSQAFHAFVSQFHIGQEISVVAEELLQLPDPSGPRGKTVYGLRVREPDTGLLVIVEAEELTMASSTTMGGALRAIKPGASLRMHVLDIEDDASVCRVHLTALEILREDLTSTIGRRQMTQALVRHVSRSPGALHVSVLSSGSLPQSHYAIVPTEDEEAGRFSPNQKVWVAARAGHRVELPLKGVPEAIHDLSSPQVVADAEKGLAILHGPIDLKTRIALRSLCRTRVDRARMDRYCRDTLRLNVRLVDLEEVSAFAAGHVPGSTCTGEVTHVRDGRGVVLIDGLPALLDWWPSDRGLAVGDQIDVVIGKVDAQKCRIVVEPIHARAEHPIQRYKINGIVRATVTSKVEHGMYVFVCPGVEGKVQTRHLGGDRFNDYRVGHDYLFQVRFVDGKRHRLTLATIPEQGQVISVEVTRMPTSGADGVVVADPDTSFSCFIPTRNLSWEKTRSAHAAVEVGKNIDVWVASADESGVRLTCRIPGTDPLGHVSVGDIVACNVTAVEPGRAVLRTAEGLQLEVRTGHVGWTDNRDLRGVLHAGLHIPHAKILSIDTASRNVQASLALPENDPTHACPQGSVVDGEVIRGVKFGVFIALPGYNVGLMHAKNLGRGYVADATDVFPKGHRVKVRVTGVDSETRRIQLAMAEVAQS